jgi:hypothetical protein
MNNAVLEGCDAPSGGGLYTSGKSKVTMLSASIKGNTAEHGGGVYIDASSVIGVEGTAHLEVRDNQASLSGGGVFLGGAQSAIKYFDVLNGSAPRGGGIAAQNATSTMLTSIQVFQNTGVEGGGGMYAHSSTITAETVKVTENAAIIGGGVYAVDSTISGSMTVSTNTGDRGGGVATSGTTTLEGTALDLNTAAVRGGGLAVEDGILSLKATTIESCSAAQGVGGGISITNADVKHYALAVHNCSSLYGGGVYANASDFYQYPSQESTGLSPYAASLTENYAAEYGGSVFIDGEGAVISDIAISNSNAPFGGGLAVLDAQGCVASQVEISYSTATKSGGGLFFGSGTNCVLRDSWVTNNQAGESGGGLMVLDGSVYHSNVDFANNVAPKAGGVYVKSDLAPAFFLWWNETTSKKSRIRGNVISPTGGNAANVMLNCTEECVVSGTLISDGKLQIGQGAGVFVCGSGNATISDSLVANNAAVKGGGIAVSGTELTTLENVALVGNVASVRGGGLYAESLDYFPQVDLLSCVFYNNSATSVGGAISLLGVYVYSSILLVVENHVKNVDTGSGGGLHAEQQASVLADNWLFLSNDATIGGGITGMLASELSLLVAYITRDSETFFTETWQELFYNLVGYEYVEGRAQYLVAVQKGGLVYLSDKNSVFELLSSVATYGSADAGGGFYITSNAFFYSEDSELSHNSANERGGSLCVSSSAQAFFVSVKVIFSGKAHCVCIITRSAQGDC